MQVSSSPSSILPGTHTFALRGWIGVVLIACIWPLNWLLTGVHTHILFFPLWLGYILVVDAWNARRTGTSLWQRSRGAFGLLFLWSIPAWWLFELVNVHAQNWSYPGREQLSTMSFVVWYSLCFSTVMPAMFETAELLRSSAWIERFAHGPVVPNTRRVQIFFFVLGWIMLGALLLWPRYCFCFVWTAPFFVLEPVNVWTGRHGIFPTVARGDWRTVAALWAASLVCGFFWEMWNMYSYPKWIYHVPFVNFWHIFEMPVLGYSGYLPFSLALYTLVYLWPRGLHVRVEAQPSA